MRTSKKMNIINRILYNRKFGIILSVLQLAITIIFSGLIINLNILPNKYLMPAIGILLFFEVITLFTQLSTKGRRFGKIISLLICLILGLGINYLFKAQSVLADISNISTKIDDVSIIVLKEDPAQHLEDLEDYLFGIHETIDRENTDKTIEKINNDLKTEIKTQAFSDFEGQVDALYNKQVGAIILNEAYRETVIEIYEDFNERTRVITGHKIETPVVIEPSDKDVLEDSFNVYISGIDTYGSIRTTSRSDVNIIATVNPKTKKILLTTTPRDYYVPFPISGGMRDKLTHAGVYGIDVSIGTLEALYDIDIDYYARVNFSSLIKMVDALGGITVNSEYAFNAGGFSFNKGINHLNGEQALAFSRERKSFAAGDNQRGKNQMEVIRGMINKAMSPAIITNYNSIMNSLAGSIDTNMSTNEITSLVKMQLDDMTPWEIETNNVIGTGAMETTYTYKTRRLYVMIPDYDSVEAAKEKIKQVMEE